VCEQIIGIKSPSLPHVQCSLPANVSKNRYANINSCESLGRGTNLDKG